MELKVSEQEYAVKAYRDILINIAYSHHLDKNRKAAFNTLFNFTLNKTKNLEPENESQLSCILLLLASQYSVKIGQSTQAEKIYRQFLSFSAFSSKIPKVDTLVQLISLSAQRGEENTEKKYWEMLMKEVNGNYCIDYCNAFNEFVSVENLLLSSKFKNGELFSFLHLRVAFNFEGEQERGSFLLQCFKENNKKKKKQEMAKRNRGIRVNIVFRSYNSEKESFIKKLEYTPTYKDESRGYFDVNLTDMKIPVGFYIVEINLSKTYLENSTELRLPQIVSNDWDTTADLNDPFLLENSPFDSFSYVLVDKLIEFLLFKMSNEYSNGRRDVSLVFKKSIENIIAKCNETRKQFALDNVLAIFEELESKNGRERFSLLKLKNIASNFVFDGSLSALTTKVNLYKSLAVASYNCGELKESKNRCKNIIKTILLQNEFSSIFQLNLAKIYFLLCEIYLCEGKTNKSLINLQKSVSIFDKIGETAESFQVKLFEATLFEACGMKKEALEIFENVINTIPMISTFKNTLSNAILLQAEFQLRCGEKMNAYFSCQRLLQISEKKEVDPYFYFPPFFFENKLSQILNECASVGESLKILKIVENAMKEDKSVLFPPLNSFSGLSFVSFSSTTENESLFLKFCVKIFKERYSQKFFFESSDVILLQVYHSLDEIIADKPPLLAVETPLKNQFSLKKSSQYIVFSISNLPVTSSFFVLQFSLLRDRSKKTLLRHMVTAPSNVFWQEDLEDEKTDWIFVSN